jgi:hypothetical protein
MTAKLMRLLQVVIIALMFASIAYGATGNQALVLLLPDGQSKNDAKVTVWLEAAKEEGLLVNVMYDKDFIKAAANGVKLSGVILPDQVHLRASDTLITAINNYVSKGGNVLLTYDFGLLTDIGFYATKSRFSSMVGVDYAVGGSNSGFGLIVGMADTMWQLQVPPGKTMDYKETLPIKPFKLQWTPGGNPVRIAPSSVPQAISAYSYGIINYNSYITTTAYSGTALLVSPQYGLAAGISNCGKGKILFVNIPLGYFASIRDGILLHGFLHYFGVEMLQLPCLSILPDARGGLVLNWHFCAGGVVQKAIEKLNSFGVWDRGIFSISITAGPDQRSPGDGLGFDIPNNPAMQKRISVLQEKGHSIGNHGGWIHDYYGLKANENNSAEFLKYLVLNADAIKAITGQTALEYAAPCGNNPQWAMDWLEGQGVVGYYFVGDTGSAPNRAYHNGVISNPKMWAFSVSPFGKYAVWEEFDTYNIPEKDVEKWYLTLMDFVVKYRTARLIYMHPQFAQFHHSVLNNLFDRADLYAGQGLFQWYTMAQLGQFENSRLKTIWNIIDLSGGNFRFEATHPVSLETMAWLLPKTGFKNKPVITAGKGTVTADIDNWVVIATSGKLIKFTATRNNITPPK